ncbi:hypothetical protein LTR10_017246 [Elasticomyces elasticus]|nr:hypothetical protein LTR10_017246 [Elasticomyces elasticus]
MVSITSKLSELSLQEPPTMDGKTSGSPHIHLQIPEHDELLEIIDTLRSQGITRYIDLPQLIVCGDQSAGKSSVLEAISGGLRFPTKDSVCTRFPIELTLRRDPVSSVAVSIIPHEARTQDEKVTLAKFRPPTSSLDQFPKIIEAAAAAMGIDGVRQLFSGDALRVEVCGPAQPHLSLIDLPGLYHAGDGRQSRQEAGSIHALVKSYMKRERSIILAVVSGKNDYNNQIVTEYAREADPQGERTLGIVTKPDTLHAGSTTQKAYQALATDNTRFKLGWHFLRNRDYDTKDSTTAERDAAEENFFQRHDWKWLPKGRVGVDSLRTRLSRILLSHISRELPKLLRDVQSGVEECQQQLKRLGISRTTLKEQRRFLFEASRDFETLMKASINGNYLDAFFGAGDTDDEYNKRLRAVTQNLMDKFACTMQERGHQVKLVDTISSKDNTEGIPRTVAKKQFYEYVRKYMIHNRGRGLPGTFNPDVVTGLFAEQAKPWGDIIREAQGKLMKAAEATASLISSTSLIPLLLNLFNDT